MKYVLILSTSISLLFLYRMDQMKLSYLKDLKELKQVNVQLSNELFAKDSCVRNSDEFFPNNKMKDIVTFKINYFTIKK